MINLLKNNDIASVNPIVITKTIFLLLIFPTGTFIEINSCGSISYNSTYLPLKYHETRSSFTPSTQSTNNLG